MARWLLSWVAIGMISCAGLRVAGQNTPETPAKAGTEYKVYGDHPRLFLGAQRLRRLRRERERKSPRWTQFETLIAGKAKMAEPGFAQALYYRVAGDEAAARQAIQWALSPAAELRQMALVFDWCQPVLDSAQSAALAAKLRQQLEAQWQSDRVPDVRSRLLAAIALSGHVPGVPEDQLRRIVETWWASRPALPREHDYALFELMHALRDNLEIDLQEKARGLFTKLPLEHLLGYYPAVYPAPENDYQIPCFHGGEPDLARAASFRAAELAMIAYNPNTLEYQYLQGWLMRDRFVLRSVFGAPYEFLWANPYQPGLSYRGLPLVFYDAPAGRVFARASWNEDSQWLGYFDRQLQTFEDGEIKPVDLRKMRAPVRIGSTLLVPGSSPLRFKLDLPEGGHVFIVGLGADRKFEVEVDDEEMSEETTGRGGILALDFPPETRAGVRMRESSRAAVSVPAQSQ